MNTIRKGRKEDLEEVFAIYDDILSREEAGEASAGWVRGIYPTESTAEEALAAGELFVMTEDGAVVAAARINQCQAPEYKYAAWDAPDALPGRIMVLHTLTVKPSCAGRGFGGEFIRFYEEYAKNAGCFYLRMDTNEKNYAARALYKKMGFGEKGTIPCCFNGLENVRLVCLEKALDSGVSIRTAKKTDAEALLLIYAPYVLNTAITFEYDVPTAREFCGRIEKTLERYPYIVAEERGEPVGYAYAGAFSPRAAYSRSVEMSVYVRWDMRGKGIGKKLYLKMEELLARQNILNVNACIAYPETEDCYLDRSSAKFHEHMGYCEAGKFHRCGYKFGRWYDMIWMEKFIGEHTANPKEVIWFPDIEK